MATKISKKGERKAVRTHMERRRELWQ